MKEFLKKKGIKLAVLVLVVALIVTVGAKTLGGTAGLVEDMAGAVRVPIQKAAAAVAEWLGGVYGYLYEYDQLKAENDALRIQLSEAQAQVRAGADSLEENQRLRDLLGLAQAHTDYTWAAAKIVSWNSSNWEYTATVSKGSKDGVELGDAVITEYGALVGQVVEVGTTWSTVRMLTDTATNVGALVGEEGAVAIAEGNYALMQDGCLKLGYLAEGAQMFIGDAVITSGNGGVFPQGINIGTVTSILTEAGGQVEYGVITPACKFGGLVQVFIIRDFDVVE